MRYHSIQFYISTDISIEMICIEQMKKMKKTGLSSCQSQLKTYQVNLTGSCCNYPESGNVDGHDNLLKDDDKTQ